MGRWRVGPGQPVPRLPDAEGVPGSSCTRPGTAERRALRRRTAAIRNERTIAIDSSGRRKTGYSGDGRAAQVGAGLPDATVKRSKKSSVEQPNLLRPSGAMCSESPAESPGGGVPAEHRRRGVPVRGLADPSYGRFAGAAVPGQKAFAVSVATLCPVRKRESSLTTVILVATCCFSVCPRGGIGQ